MKITKYMIVLLLTGMAFAGFACARQSARLTPVVKVVKEFGPAVVNISTDYVVPQKQSLKWEEKSKALDTVTEEETGQDLAEGKKKYYSVGAGVIVDVKGLIVTNAHVVSNASDIYVTLYNGDVYKASLIGMEKDIDLALVRIIPIKAIKQVKFADTDKIMLGETVVSIGDPLGFENSVDTGIISGIHRTFQTKDRMEASKDLIQTDVPINPGNSGGGIFNLDGELVGINIAVEEHAQDIGFAISADKVEKMMQKYRTAWFNALNNVTNE